MQSETKNIFIEQTWFDEQQLKFCEFELLDCRDKCPPAFESSLIYESLEAGKHKDRDYYGLLSWQFNRKVIKRHPNGLPNRENITHYLNTHDPDVLSFWAWKRDVNMITQATRIHTKFMEVLKYTLDVCGIPIDEAIKRQKGSFVIMANYWIAKPHVWDDYKKTVLDPFFRAEETDETFRNLLWSDSGYFKKKRPDIRERLVKHLGVPYYPYHAFILERMPTIFLTFRQYNCEQFC